MNSIEDAISRLLDTLETMQQTQRVANTQIRELTARVNYAEDALEKLIYFVETKLDGQERTIH